MTSIADTGPADALEDAARGRPAHAGRYSIGEFGNRLLRGDDANVGGPATLVQIADAGHWSVSDLCGLIAAFNAGCGDGVRGSVGGSMVFTYVDPVIARAVSADAAASFFATHVLADPGGDTIVRRLDGTRGARVQRHP